MTEHPSDTEVPHPEAEGASEQGNEHDESSQVAGERAPDPAVTALLVGLRLLGQATSEADIRRRSGCYGPFGIHEVLDAAQTNGLTAERVSIRGGDLSQLPAPAIVEGYRGHFWVLAETETGERCMVLDPLSGEELDSDDQGLADKLTGEAVLLGEGRQRSATGQRESFGLRSLLPGLLRYKGALAQVLGASAFVQLFAMVTPLFTMVIIDRVLTTGAMSTLNVLIFGLAAIAIFDLVIGLLRGALLANLTHRIDADLVARLFRHLTRLPLSYLGAQRTGDTVARVRELESVRQFLTGPSLTAIIDFVFAFLFIAVMSLFSIKLTLIVVAAMILMLAVYAVGAPLMRKRLERRFASSSDNQSFLTETLSGMETVKALSLEPQMQREWEQRAVEQTGYARESERLTGGLSQIAQFLNKGTVALTLWLGAQMVITGDFTAGQLIAFNMMVGRVMAPAQRLAQLFQQLSQTGVSVARLREIFDTPPEPVVHSAADRLPPMTGSVRFEQVSFRYQPDQPDILRDVGFNVRPGEVVGVAGASGSGKSSLLRLLQRLYVPTAGRVLVDGVNVAEIDPVWLRRHIGAVTQDNVLFSGTVRENIAAANPDLPIEQVEEAARLAAADEFIRALPSAYDTPVGEHGAKLSVGQRQRIALARALAADPRMLLLDEPTSSLDAQAEARIQANLADMVRERTVFVVAHRLSTLRFCDRILVLEEGQLVEQGAPNELLQRDGVFARLKRAQLDPAVLAEREEVCVAT